MKELLIKLGSKFIAPDFNLDIEDLKHIFGEPTKIDVEDYRDGEFSKSLEYVGLGISISLSYYDNKLDNYKFYLEDLNIGSVALSGLNKEPILDVLVEFYHEKNYVFEFEKVENVTDDCLYFSKIGLTLWFEKDNLTDICLEKTTS